MVLTKKELWLKGGKRLVLSVLIGKAFREMSAEY